jgi:hypothetical protein
MSEQTAYARKRKNVTIKDSLKEAAGHLKDLMIAPQLKGKTRDANRDKYVDDAVYGKTASLTIKKRRKAA